MEDIQDDKKIKQWYEKIKISSELSNVLNELIGSKEKLETIVEHSEKRNKDMIRNYFSNTLKIMNDICKNLHAANDYIMIINYKNYEALSNLIFEKITFKSSYTPLITKYDELRTLENYLEKKRYNRDQFYFFTITKIAIEEYKKFLTNLWNYYNIIEDYLDDFENFANIKSHR